MKQSYPFLIPLYGLSLFLGACGGGGSGGTGSGTPPPASATQFSVSPASGSATAGNGLNVTVQALDDSNNLVSSFAGTLQESSSDANAVLPGPLSFSGGTATFVVTFNTAGNQTISVSSGSLRGTSPAITVSSAVLAILTGALSSGVIGTPFNQTIQATGGVAPFAWKVSSGALPHNLSLNPSTADTVTISGTPDTASQGLAFTIQVSDSARHSATQPYTVSILLQADSLVLSAGSLDFGNQIVGSASGALTETLSNTATADMVISSIAINTYNQPSNPGEFTQSGTTCGSTLAAGASCAINLTFTPGQTGPRAAVLTITDDTAGSPQSVGLAGVGLITGPNATLSTESLPFLGTELVGTTSPARTLSLSNYGTAALSIGSVSATASFAETNDCVGSLPSLGTCTIRVTFTPGSSGNVTGTLSISDDAAGGLQKVTLSGTGSTNTPPLNGFCVTSCGLAMDTAQCPVGQPSDNPVSVSLGPTCGVGPGGASAVLDEARSCAALIRGRRFTGACEAD